MYDVNVVFFVWCLPERVGTCIFLCYLFGRAQSSSYSDYCSMVLIIKLD